MKQTILILLFAVFAHLLSANEKPVFNIEPKDVQSIEIELTPAKAIQVRVNFSSLEKIKEFKALQKENYRKPVIMQVNGETVYEVTLIFEPPHLGNNTSFAFTEMKEALDLVYSLMPERRPIKPE